MMRIHFRMPVMFLVFCCICINVRHAAGQGQNLNYIQYNSNNSKLPHNIVYGLQQDHNKYLWICTDDGLVRFDGLEMKVFEKGFTSKYVIDTDEEQGTMWACAWKSGIYFIMNDSAVFVKEQQNTRELFYTNKIIVFNEFVIAYNFNDYRIFRYDRVKQELVPDAIIPNDVPGKRYTPADPDYMQFYKTKDHRLLVYNNTTFSELQDGGLRLLRPAVHPDKIAESPDGIIYFLKDSTLYLMSSNLEQATPVNHIPKAVLQNRRLEGFCVQPSGNLALCFQTLSSKYPLKKTYCIYNPESGEVIPLDILTRAETLHAELFADHEGSLWLSTDGEGLFHIFDPQFQRYGGDDKAFRNTSITCMLHYGQDSLFIGTKAGMYLLHNRQISIADTSQILTRCHINRLLRDENNSILIGLAFAAALNSRPMYTLRGNSYVITDTITNKIVTNNYTVTYNNQGDVFLRTRKNNHVYKITIPSPVPVSDAAETADGGLAITGKSSILFFSPDSGFRYYPEYFREPAFINCLICNKGMWFGTNSGLYFIDAQKRQKHWGTNEGLTNTNIRCMLFDSSGVLWIGTQNGLFSFHNNQFAVYKKRDGLIADDVSCMCLAPGGYIAAGSSNGLTLFRIPKRNTMHHEPDLLIEQVRVNNAPVNWKIVSEIPYNSSIQIEFNTVTFYYPELTLYEYRLDPAAPWISTRNRSIQLSNLSPGNYTLEIRVKNYNTAFSKPLQIELRLLKPWWQSVLFIGTLILLVTGVLFYIIYRRQHKFKKEARLKQELAELKLKALQAQLNPHFISNTLNAIQYFILKKEEVTANDYLSQFSDITRQFLEISRTRYITLRQELDLLQNYTSLEKLRFGNKLECRITVAPEITPDTTYIPGLIIQPFIENSINHGLMYLPDNIPGTITVQIAKNEKQLFVTIDDNGIGREKAMAIREREGKRFRSQSGDIISELLETYNSLAGWKIAIQFTDKKDSNGAATGTLVKISIRLPDSADIIIH